MPRTVQDGGDEGNLKAAAVQRASLELEMPTTSSITGSRTLLSFRAAAIETNSESGDITLHAMLAAFLLAKTIFQ